MYSLTKHNSFFLSAAADQLGSASSHNMNIETEASNIMCTTLNTTKLIQRRVRSHALYKSDLYSLPSLSEGPEDGPVRRVHSAGALEGVSSCIAKGKENSMIIDGMMKKASRYSPEEKRERINKYRSKRNLRNFNKKIQYECRKALADSRTRFRGRFVRNDEISIMTTTMMKTMESNVTCGNLLSKDHSSTYHHHMVASGDEDDEGEENGWINLLDYY